MKSNRAYRQQGFMIIEIIVVVALIAIIIGLMMPATQNMLKPDNTDQIGAVQNGDTKPISGRRAYRLSTQDQIQSRLSDETASIFSPRDTGIERSGWKVDATGRPAKSHDRYSARHELG